MISFHEAHKAKVGGYAVYGRDGQRYFIRRAEAGGAVRPIDGVACVVPADSEKSMPLEDLFLEFNDIPATDKARLHLQAMIHDSGSVIWRVAQIRQDCPDFPEEEIKEAVIKTANFVFRAHGSSNPNFVLKRVTEIIEVTSMTWEDLEFSQEDLAANAS